MWHFLFPYEHFKKVCTFKRAQHLLDTSTWLWHWPYKTFLQPKKTKMNFSMNSLWVEIPRPPKLAVPRSISKHMQLISLYLQIHAIIHLSFPFLKSPTVLLSIPQFGSSLGNRATILSTRNVQVCLLKLKKIIMWTRLVEFMMLLAINAEPPSHINNMSQTRTYSWCYSLILAVHSCRV